MSYHSARHSFWAFALLSAGLSAQTPTFSERPISTADPAHPQTSSGPTHRTSSRETAAALAGIKFEAPPEPKKEEEKPDNDVDLRDVDKPRNGIVRLPKYTVQGERPPVFTEREINTKKGMADLAVKRYLSTVGQGLNKFHLPSIMGGLSNDDIAMQMYRDNERIQNNRDMNEKLSLFRDAGAKDADSMQKDSTSTYRPTGQFTDPATSAIPTSGPRILKRVSGNRIPNTIVSSSFALRRRSSRVAKQRSAPTLPPAKHRSLCVHCVNTSSAHCRRPLPCGEGKHEPNLPPCSPPAAQGCAHVPNRHAHRTTAPATVS